MSSLEEVITERIRESGPLTLAEYMDLALAHPEYGYYMKGDPFGAGGDFITAPEISQMFGELLSLWSAVVWQSMGSPERINLVELGPGRGTLMSDVLRAAPSMPGFANALNVHMIETSPALKKRQQDALQGAPGAPQWHSTIEDVPDGPLIVLANEFFDALPIDQYFRAGQYWCPRVIDLKPEGDGFCFVLLPPYDAQDLPPGLEDVADGSMVEVCPTGLDVAASLAGRIKDFGGAALVIDYGHGESGPGETLQAVHKHSYHDPLKDPGMADLTAHVDFGALSQRVFASGVRAHGPVSQGAFLEALGIRERAATLSQNATQEQVEEILSALQRLTADDQMGQLFKVLAMTPLGAPVPPGFE